MIIVGVILLILGAILYFSGVEINNDMDAQMESLFNDGVTNPGATYETIGILLLICGILLVIIGAIRKMDENKSSNYIPQNKERLIVDNGLSNSKKCAYCGAVVSEKSNFCPNCGKENSNFIICPNCSKRIAVDSVFCDFCGAEMILFKFSLENKLVGDIISTAFDCIKLGDFNNATLLLDSADKKSAKNPMVSLGKLLIYYKLHTAEDLADLKKDFSIHVHFHNIMISDNEELKKQIRLYHMYSQACISMDKRDYTHALELFDKIGEWRDSKEKAEYCQRKVGEENI